MNEQPTTATAPADEKVSADKLQLKVYSPFKVYFDGPATSVSAVNETGPFDILARHHNFITLLKACDLAINAPGGSDQVRISGGIMHVRANKVTVFLDV